MTSPVTLADAVNSPSAERVLGVVKTAVDRLARAFLVVQDGFSDELVAPMELRTAVPLRIFDARLRVEVAILSATAVGSGTGSANFALRVIETELSYNMTPDDRDRLFAGIVFLFGSATMIRPKGYEDSLCFRLPSRDLDA